MQEAIICGLAGLAKCQNPNYSLWQGLETVDRISFIFFLSLQSL